MATGHGSVTFVLRFFLVSHVHSLITNFISSKEASWFKGELVYNTVEERLLRPQNGDIYPCCPSCEYFVALSYLHF
jgi:hypothetical protein